MAIDLKNYEPALMNGGGISVTGASTFASTLGVTGATTLSSTLGVTGAATLSSTLGVTGMTTLTGGLIGGTQALSGAGAINLTTLVTKITSTGADALTLANGTDGQVKIIVMVVDGGDATLTPTTKTGFSTITFNDAGDGVVLVYTTTTGWIVAGNNGATLA